MSISLESWESVLDLASMFVPRLIPPNYSSEHVNVLIDMIRHVVPGEISVTTLLLPTLEPVISYSKGAGPVKIFISHYSLSYYINQPTIKPVKTTKFVNKFNVLDKLDTFLDHQGYIPKTVVLKNRSPEVFGQETVNILSKDEIKIRTLIRLAVLVAHWSQHYFNNIPFDSHCNFPQLELANDKRNKSDDEELIVDETQIDKYENPTPWYI